MFVRSKRGEWSIFMVSNSPPFSPPLSPYFSPLWIFSPSWIIKNIVCVCVCSWAPVLNKTPGLCLCMHKDLTILFVHLCLYVHEKRVIKSLERLKGYLPLYCRVPCFHRTYVCLCDLLTDQPHRRSACVPSDSAAARIANRLAWRRERSGDAAAIWWIGCLKLNVWCRCNHKWWSVIKLWSM